MLPALPSGCSGSSVTPWRLWSVWWWSCCWLRPSLDFWRPGGAVPVLPEEEGAAEAVASGAACSWAVCWATPTAEGDITAPVRPEVPVLPEAVASVEGLAASTVVEAAALAAEDSAEAAVASMVEAVPAAAEPAGGERHEALLPPRFGRHRG